MNALVDLVIYIVLIGLVCGLLLWRIDWVPIPELVRDVAPGSPIAPVDSASPANGIRQA